MIVPKLEALIKSPLLFHLIILLPFGFPLAEFVKSAFFVCSFLSTQI